MKVLFVLNTTVMGGGNISFINMLKGLHAKGMECYIVSPDREVEATFQEMAKDYVQKFYYAPLVSYFYAEPRYLSGLRKLKAYARIAVYCNPFIRKYRADRELSYMDKIVAEVKPDIIHTNVGVIHVGHVAAKKWHIPHVWHLREYQTKDFHCMIAPSYDKFVEMLHEDYVITITKDILQYFKLTDNPKAQYIYNGCFFKADVTLTLPKSKYLLCCSRVAEEKGHRDVIDAFAVFHKKYPEYKLVIAGFGDDQFISELRVSAEQRGCSEAVDFIGYRKDVRPLMNKAQALIVASRCEGFGRMTAEAAFCGCLVVGHNTGGTKEILDVTGGFPYEGGAEMLEQKMEEIAALSDKEYRLMAEKAQQEAVVHFSNEAYVDGVYSLYKKIMDAKRN